MTKLLNSLSLDVKTRWNSVVKMHRVFPHPRWAIFCALRELSLAHLILIDNEKALIESVSKCLEVVAAGATELGLNDMDLGQADEVMEFILNHLRQVKSSPFGCSMHDAITL